MGSAAARNNCQGRKGRDLLLKVPCGTLVKDVKTGELLHDFTTHKERLVICKGGKGGRGNEGLIQNAHQPRPQHLHRRHRGRKLRGGV